MVKKATYVSGRPEPKNYDSVVGSPIDSHSAYFAQLGSSGLSRFGNHVYEEFIPKLRFPQAAKIYQEMSDNDPTVGAIFYMTEQLVRSAKWYVKPASDDAKDIETAKFVEECMHDMSSSWADFICESISMFVYGWSCHEVIYKYRRGISQKNGKFRSKFDDGKIGWRNMPGMAQSSLFGWDFAKDGGAVAIIQQAPPHFEQIRIPLDKALLFRTKVIRNNPEGKSLLRNAYRPWYFKKRMEEIEGIGIERDLAGLPVLTTPENVNIFDEQNPQAVAIRQQAEQIVRSIRRDQQEGVVLPFGYELTLLSTGGSRQFDTNEIINRYDQRIAITMLSDLVMLGADKVGSFALADVKKSLMATAIEAQVQSIADVINKHAVTSLMEINNIECKNGYPQIIADHVQAPSIEDVSKIVEAGQINVMGDIDTANYMRELIGIRPLTEEQFKTQKKESEDLKSMFASPKNLGYNDNKGNNVNDSKGGKPKDGKPKTKPTGANTKV